MELGVGVIMPRAMHRQTANPRNLFEVCRALVSPSMHDFERPAIETKLSGQRLRTIGVTEMCSRCGSLQPRHELHVVELGVTVRDVDVPDSEWVCIDSQSCVLARIFLDLT